MSHDIKSRDFHMFTMKILWFWLKSGSLENLGNNKIDHIVAI